MRDPADDGPPEPGGAPDPPPSGSLVPTPPLSLLGWALVGVVLGLGVRAVATPLVSWVQPVTLVVAAVVVAGAAATTWRQVQVRRERLLPHQAVNRFVLGRASAYVGAVVGGAYLGYAVTWVSADQYELGTQRLVRSLVAGVAGLVIAVAGLLLERACRVRRGPEEP